MRRDSAELMLKRLTRLHASQQLLVQFNNRNTRTRCSICSKLTTVITSIQELGMDE